MGEPTEPRNSLAACQQMAANFSQSLSAVSMLLLLPHLLLLVLVLFCFRYMYLAHWPVGPLAWSTPCGHNVQLLPICKLLLHMQRIRLISKCQWWLTHITMPHTRADWRPNDSNCCEWSDKSGAVMQGAPLRTIIRFNNTTSWLRVPYGTRPGKFLSWNTTVCNKSYLLWKKKKKNHALYRNMWIM